MKDYNITTTLLKVIKDDIIPLTQKKIKRGNKIFGAAILKKSDYSLILAASNEETQNPLFHGEISCLNKYWKLPQAPPPKDCIFLSTHEPCSLCLSAITWSGFDNFYYFFSYENSKDDFLIGHDLKILNEVFNCHKGEYRKENFYWKSYHLLAMIQKLPQAQKEECLKDVSFIQKKYQKLSDIYQQKKKQTNIPLS